MKSNYGKDFILIKPITSTNPVVQYLSNCYIKTITPTPKQIAENNPKLMTAAQALAIEAAALVKKQKI